MKTAVEMCESIFSMKIKLYGSLVAFESNIKKEIVSRKDHYRWERQYSYSRNILEKINKWKLACQMSLETAEPYTKQFVLDIFYVLGALRGHIKETDFSDSFKGIIEQQFVRLGDIIHAHYDTLVDSDDLAESSNNLVSPDDLEETIKEDNESILHKMSKDLLVYLHFCQQSKKEPIESIVDGHMNLIIYCINQGANPLQTDKQGIMSLSNLFEILSKPVFDKFSDQLRNALQESFTKKTNSCRGYDFYRFEKEGKGQPWTYNQLSMLKLLIDQWCLISAFKSNPAITSCSNGKKVGDQLNQKLGIIEEMLEELVDVYRYKQPAQCLLQKMNCQLEKLRRSTQSETRAFCKKMDAELLRYYTSRDTFWVPACNHQEDKKEDKVTAKHRAVDWVVHDSPKSRR